MRIAMVERVVRGRSVGGIAAKRLAGSAALLVGFLATTQVAAGPSERAQERASTALREVEAAAAQLSNVRIVPKKRDAARLLALAELHFRSGQHEVAIDKLNMVVELHRQGKASAGTDADAQLLLGESYFATGQLYSAKRHFEVVTDRADRPSYAGLGGRAASRLVDIALQMRTTEELPEVLERVEKMIARGATPSLLYARAKALYAMGSYESATDQATAITGSTIYTQRAAYLRGTALMKAAQAAADTENTGQPPDYRAAIAAFEQAAVPVTDLKEDQELAAQVTDLSWLAVARLHYSVQRFGRAAQAYQKVPRSSEYFAQGLFEMAWTYVRLGEFERAQRALEALSVLDPGLLDGADGELLRGDLLLRAGQFAEAEEAYEAVRNKYEPLREQVHEYIETHDDPAIYYDKLTAAEIETGHDLPSVAVDWAREAAEEDRIFAIVDDVARSRSLIKRSRRIITLLRASLASGSRAKVFPELQRHLEDVISLINRLAVARLSLARGMDENAGSASTQLSTVRERRRSLMGRLGEVPTNHGDFSVRVAQAERSWNGVSQNLQRLQLEADHLRALVAGLHRVVADADRHGLNVDAATLERFRQEISENEKDLQVYDSRIDDLRQQVEMGRVQAGLGDERFVKDDEVREQFRKLFEQEVTLAAGGGDSRAASYSKQIGPLLGKIRAVEAQLEGARDQLDGQARDRGEEIGKEIDTEAKAIEVYASRLDTMDQHARLLVGEVARSNFIKARDRIRDVVMRADVGLVQQAWEVREEQRYRVRDLLRERAQEERFINDELREVLDDAEEQ